MLDVETCEGAWPALEVLEGMTSLQLMRQVKFQYLRVFWGYLVYSGTTAALELLPLQRKS